MSRTGKRLLVAIAGLLLPLAALAQPAPQTAGIEFQLATEVMTPNDSRISGGASVFRLGFNPGGALVMFYERIGETFTFKNGGSVASAPGEVSMDGVGVGYTFGTLRFEIMTGRASTTTTNGAVNSSDSVTDIGFIYSYRPAQQRALIEVGLVDRLLKLSNPVAGNVVGGGTQTKELSDMGGLILRIGIGYAF
jgi:hypothetical protein